MVLAMNEREQANQPSRRVTLADVAAKSGVALSTASRALAGSSRVHPLTRDTVLAAAKELGYVHGPRTRAAQKNWNGARGRGNPDGRAVLMLVPDLLNPFYFSIISGAQRTLRNEGFSLVLENTEESNEIESRVLRELLPLYDGAIVAASRVSERQLAGVSERAPVVAINRQTKSVPHVFIDTPTGVSQALTYLQSLGHTRVAYASGPPYSWSNERRTRALHANAENLPGMELMRLGPFPPTLDAGNTAAAEVLASGATACIAFNDLMAIGLMQALQQRGARVPEDISVIGCDDIFGASFASPPLTTVTAPTDRAGMAAASILVGLIRGDINPDARRNAVLLTHLTVRESSGPPPGKSTGAR